MGRLNKERARRNASAVGKAADTRVARDKFEWCAREDLNLHPLRDRILSPARLPFRHARDVTDDAELSAPSQAWIAQQPRVPGQPHARRFTAPGSTGRQWARSNRSGSANGPL